MARSWRFPAPVWQGMGYPSPRATQARLCVAAPATRLRLLLPFVSQFKEAMISTHASRCDAARTISLTDAARGWRAEAIVQAGAITWAHERSKAIEAHRRRQEADMLFM